MLEYQNNVINGVPVKGHSIYVLALSDLNSQIYNDLNNSLGSGYNFNTTLKTIPGYVWDLYSLPKKCSLDFRYDIFSQNATIRYTLPFLFSTGEDVVTPYRPIWVNNYNDNAGDNLFERLPTYYPTTNYNKLRFDKQTYKVSQFNFSPLITKSSNSNEHINAENTIYKASIIPMFPLMLVSSNPNHTSYGPVFMESFSINLAGFSAADLPEVEISCSFTGGKSIVSPTDVLETFPATDIEKEIKFAEFKEPTGTVLSGIGLYDGISTAVGIGSTTDVNGVGAGVTTNNVGETGTGSTSGSGSSSGIASTTIMDFRNYRSANLADCIVTNNISNENGTGWDFRQLKNKLIKSYESGLGVTTSDATNYQETKRPFDGKIVAMNLTISQEIDFTFTVPEFNKTYFGDLAGPKFASLKSRTATGSISMYNPTAEQYLDRNTYSPLTMFFGNNFLYTFARVDWNNPKVDLTPNGGKIVTFSFIARSGKQTFWGSGYNHAVSEVDIKWQSIINL